MILNLLTNPVACCNKANRCQLCSNHQKKGSIKCETGKWEAVVTNDSIGTCSSVLHIDYFLKLPAPPRAALLENKMHVCVVLKNSRIPDRLPNTSPSRQQFFETNLEIRKTPLIVNIVTCCHQACWKQVLC